MPQRAMHHVFYANTHASFTDNNILGSCNIKQIII
jgi:hypothetical protein